MYEEREHSSYLGLFAVYILRMSIACNRFVLWFFFVGHTFHATGDSTFDANVHFEDKEGGLNQLSGLISACFASRKRIKT